MASAAGRLVPLLLLAVACRGMPGLPAPAPTFQVAVFGDMPYIQTTDTTRGAGVMREYERVLHDIARARPAFVVHVGDLTGFHCADSVLHRRRAEFTAFPAPLVYLFGENEWADCRRNEFDPLERLALLRALFTGGSASLGTPAMPLVRQSDDPRFAAYRENVRWERGGVVFVGLHAIPLPPDWDRHPAQVRTRIGLDSANVHWLREAFAHAARRRARGIALFLQGNPGWGVPLQPELAAVQAELQRLASNFAGQIVVVHGDGHICRVDRPVVAGDGRPLPHVTRAETFGGTRHHWLQLTVAPASDTIFRVVPRFVEGNEPASCTVFGQVVTPPARP